MSILTKQAVYAHQVPVVAASSRRPGRTSKTQLKLFQAAMDIMNQLGPEATTVEEVAARAGVSKGTVYYNFGSKQTMIDQLLLYGAKLLLAEMALVASGPDPRVALRNAIEAALLYLGDHPGFARLWVSELWRNGPGSPGTTDLIRDDIMRFLLELVQSLGRYYRVDSSRSPEGVALAIFGSVFMMTMDEALHGSQRSHLEAADVTMLIVDGYLK